MKEKVKVEVNINIVHHLFEGTYNCENESHLFSGHINDVHLKHCVDV